MSVYVIILPIHVVTQTDLVLSGPMEKKEADARTKASREEGEIGS